MLKSLELKLWPKVGPGLVRRAPALDTSHSGFTFATWTTGLGINSQACPPKPGAKVWFLPHYQIGRKTFLLIRR